MDKAVKAFLDSLAAKHEFDPENTLALDIAILNTPVKAFVTKNKAILAAFLKTEEALFITPLLYIERGLKRNKYTLLFPFDEEDEAYLKRKLKHIFKLYEHWLKSGKPTGPNYIKTANKILSIGNP